MEWVFPLKLIFHICKSKFNNFSKFLFFKQITFTSELFFFGGVEKQGMINLSITYKVKPPSFISKVAAKKMTNAGK